MCCFNNLMKGTWQDSKQAIKDGHLCPALKTRFKHQVPGVTWSPKQLNYKLQRDFIGPLNTHRGLSACIVLGLAIESHRPVLGSQK